MVINHLLTGMILQVLFVAKKVAHGNKGVIQVSSLGRSSPPIQEQTSCKVKIRILSPLTSFQKNMLKKNTTYSPGSITKMCW